MDSIPRNRLMFILIGVGAVVVLAVVIFLNLQPKQTANAVTLTVWGTDSHAVMDPLIAAYNQVRPNVTIKYSPVDQANYADVLLRAFAAGQGPDVFMLGNHDLRKFEYLMAAPDATQFAAAQVDSLFPRAVTDDFVDGGQVYALPLYMDTLALIYNRDMLDQAGIAKPPATWQDFLADVPLLRKTNAQGQLTATAAAIGGTEGTVPNASDLVALLMLQNGAVMNTPQGTASFAGGTGLQAFQFYLDFANPASAAYTWSEAQGNGADNFLAGRTAIVFDYHDNLKAYKARSPFLNYAAAPMPQASSGQTVNYPAYKGLGVWKRSPNANWAWDFVINAGTNSAVNKPYLNQAGRSPALRSLIQAAVADLELGLFARQSLTARSWAIPDYAKMKTIMSNAIQMSLTGQTTADKALRGAQEQLNQLGQ